MQPDRRYERFEVFLRDFVRELNDASLEGGVVLVEGKRDSRALMDVGYTGKIVSIDSLGRGRSRATLTGAKRVIIMTDLDREGRRLAARYVKLLAHDGAAPSLEHRRRFSLASRGSFLHIENLSRFSHVGVKLRPPAIQEFK